MCHIYFQYFFSVVLLFTSTALMIISAMLLVLVFLAFFFSMVDIFANFMLCLNEYAPHKLIEWKLLLRLYTTPSRKLDPHPILFTVFKSHGAFLLIEYSCQVFNWKFHKKNVSTLVRVTIHLYFITINEWCILLFCKIARR